MTALSALLAARRPHRVDAARNFDSILVAARQVFNETSGQGTLDDIARRAGVGIATLYRNFPTRESLIEAVYVAEVDQVCQYAEELSTLPPGEALFSWLERFVVYLHTKRALVEGLTQEAVENITKEEAYLASRSAIYATGAPLLEHAQAAGEARTDVDIDDVMRFIFAVTAGAYRSDEQRHRIVDLALASVRPASVLPRTTPPVDSGRPETG